MTPRMNLDEEQHPLRLWRLIQHQSNIGWTHWIKGKWTTDWIHTFNSMTNTTKGLQWCTTLLKTIWLEYHQIWQIRNNKLHQPDNQFEIQRQNDMLDRTIEDTYNLAPLLQNIDRKRLMRPIDHLLNSTKNQKHLWITNNTKHLKTKVKQSTRPNTENPITTYFPRTKHRPQPRNNTTIASEFRPP
jgi:hypothetical protein